MAVDWSISTLSPDHIPAFLALAAAHQWISDPWELEYLCSAFPGGCLTCRTNGNAVAFVTALKHDRSGWIGNLIVQDVWRRHGIGSTLLKQALAALDAAGAETVWLTASDDGRRLYERLGFISLDRVSRWHGRGMLRSGRTDAALADMLAVDRAGWGDRREFLLDATRQRGTAAATDAGFMVLQPWRHGVQIGPWGATTAQGASAQLRQHLDLSRDDTCLFLDVPEGNSAATTLLSDTGFSRVSTTLLMYRGSKPRYAPSRIFSLASMGSMG